MGGGGAMRTAAKVAGIGVISNGIRSNGLTENPVNVAVRPALSGFSSSGLTVENPVQKRVLEIDDWEFAGSEGDECVVDRNHSGKPRMVFGPVPTIEETKEATSELKDALDKVLSSVGVGLGVVLRDWRGHVLAVGVRRFGTNWQANMAEAIAARFWVSLARNLGLHNVELECDAINLTRAVARKKIGKAPTDFIVEDICTIGASFMSFNVSHVKRCGDTVAHFVAPLFPATGVGQVFDSFVPEGVLALRS